MSNYVKPNRICRDFLQGNCNREYCRYPHVMCADQVSFCHDFQNATCPRINCKFLHVSVEFEEHYRKFGKFPPVSQDSVSAGYGVDLQPGYRDVGDSHISLQLQPHDWRHCQSPTYAHTFMPSRPPPFSLQEHSHSRMHSKCSPPLPCINEFARRGSPPNAAAQNQLQQHCQQQHQQIQQQKHIQHQQRIAAEFNNSTNINTPPNPESPRRLSACLKRNVDSCIALDDPAVAKRFRDPLPTEPTVHSSDVMAILRRFEEEHNMLRRRVETAELKISELRATNDYLLSQNTQFRLTNAAAVAAAAAVQRSMATATVTTVSQPQATMINAVSIAPVQLQANTPTIVSMAGPQIIASTSCGAPLSISANTTQGQQIAALAQQSLNTLSSTAHQAAINASAQILGTSQITLTPTLATAPSMGLTLNTSQPIACVSNASQPIISYPVMTHSILPH